MITPENEITIGSAASKDDRNGKLLSRKKRSLTRRPVTRFIGTGANNDTPVTIIPTTSSEIGPIYQPLSFGEIIHHRYRVDALLGPLERMNSYLVSPVDFNPPWCGQCAHEINDFDSFCPQCGFDLGQNQFLMLEGDRPTTNGFKTLMFSNIEHDGLLKVFDRFHYDGRFYIIAARWDGETLATTPSPDAISMFNWILVLGSALETLHSNGFYNFDLSPQYIFIRADGPKIAGIGKCQYLSEPKANSKKIKKNRRRDMLAFGRLLQRLDRVLSIPKNGTGLFSIVTEIADKTIRGEFQNMSQLMDALRHLKKDAIQTPQRTNANQTKRLNALGNKLLIGKSSDCGQVRQLNEDSIATYEFTSIFESVACPVSLCLVADGMGGHQNGEIASRIVIQQIVEAVNLALLSLGLENLNGRLSETVIKSIIMEAVEKTNEKVYQIARAKQSDMGATISMTLIIGEIAYILNVGDCRTYHFNGTRLNLITADHSFVYRLVQTGQIKYEDIVTHPQRNQILRCLGEPDLVQKLNMMAEKHDHSYWFTQTLEPGDSLLLCSDGLWEMVPEAVISEVLNEYANPQAAADELVQLANQRGGEDNISVIIAKFI